MRAALGAALLLLATAAAAQDLAVRGDWVYTMAGDRIQDGVVVVEGGRITAVGPAAEVSAPAGMRVLRAAVVTPGLVDAHSVVGLAGILNQAHDQDQLDETDAIQPELRAIDSYNAREELIEWIRGFGVTTVHAGHGPGAIVSGQTMIVKTRGETVDEAVVKPLAMMAANLGEEALEEEKGKSPGTRSKAVALLRQQLVAAQEYRRKRKAPDPSKQPDRDLRLEAWQPVLDRQVPLLVTAHRHADLMSALRVGREFGLRIVLDGASEAHVVVDEIREAGVPVIVHPTMMRASGEAENASMRTPATLRAAGIPIALQAGYESYVPKSRVVLFEAAVAAAHGLGFGDALAAITIDAARILGVADRVGSLEVGKDGDLALYDGDPFEYTSHCIGVVIDGRVVSDEAR